MEEQPSARAPRDGRAPVNVVHGVPADEVDDSDPERALYTSEPVEADDVKAAVASIRSNP